MLKKYKQKSQDEIGQLSFYELQRKPHEVFTDDTEMAVFPESIKAEFRCPICLDIIKKTMTTIDCLHRFCSECIETALRSGNKECPACRGKLVSRRPLRADLNFDALISKLKLHAKKSEQPNELQRLQLVGPGSVSPRSVPRPVTLADLYTYPTARTSTLQAIKRKPCDPESGAPQSVVPKSVKLAGLNTIRAPSTSILQPIESEQPNKFQHFGPKSFGQGSGGLQLVGPESVTPRPVPGLVKLADPYTNPTASTSTLQPIKSQPGAPQSVFPKSVKRADLDTIRAPSTSILEPKEREQPNKFQDFGRKSSGPKSVGQGSGGLQLVGPESVTPRPVPRLVKLAGLNTIRAPSTSILQPKENEQPNKFQHFGRKSGEQKSSGPKSVTPRPVPRLVKLAGINTIRAPSTSILQPKENEQPNKFQHLGRKSGEQKSSGPKSVGQGSGCLQLVGPESVTPRPVPRVVKLADPYTNPTANTSTLQPIESQPRAPKSVKLADLDTIRAPRTSILKPQESEQPNKFQHFDRKSDKQESSGPKSVGQGSGGLQLVGPKSVTPRPVPRQVKLADPYTIPPATTSTLQPIESQPGAPESGAPQSVKLADLYTIQKSSGSKSVGQGSGGPQLVGPRSIPRPAKLADLYTNPTASTSNLQPIKPQPVARELADLYTNPTASTRKLRPIKPKPAALQSFVPRLHKLAGLYKIHTPRALKPKLSGQPNKLWHPGRKSGGRKTSGSGVPQLVGPTPVSPQLVSRQVELAGFYVNPIPSTSTIQPNGGEQPIRPQPVSLRSTASELVYPQLVGLESIGLQSAAATSITSTLQPIEQSIELQPVIPNPPLIVHESVTPQSLVTIPVELATLPAILHIGCHITYWLFHHVENDTN